MQPPHFTEINTPRLRLRRFGEPDLQSFLTYRNDPLIARYQSWDTVSEADARRLIAELDNIEPGVPGEWFQIAIELKATGAHIGDCALYVRPDDPQQGELGYTLARPYHGHGYATEAVRAVLGYAFEKLHLHRMVAMIDCANHPSVAVAERAGMRREGHFLQNAWFKGRWCDEYLYAMLRAEWLERQAPLFTREP